MPVSKTIVSCVLLFSLLFNPGGSRCGQQRERRRRNPGLGNMEVSLDSFSPAAFVGSGEKLQYPTVFRICDHYGGIDTLVTDTKLPENFLLFVRDVI